MTFRRNKAIALMVLVVPLSGCASAPKPAEPVKAMAQSDVPLAVVRGEPITRQEIVEPLLESYGLNFLLLTVEFKIARQEAAKMGVTLTPQDVEAERTSTMKGLFPDAEEKDYPELLTQLLQKQGITRQQFELIVTTNMALRKIATPSSQTEITEDNIKHAFALKYGAKVQISDIKLPNAAAAQLAKERLTKQPFETVARMMSTDPVTAPNGGLCLPFGAASMDVNQVIKDHAFAMKVGEVSDILSTDNVFHIIRVEHLIPPSSKAVKLEGEVHDYLKKQLIERLIEQKIKVMRAQIAQEVTSSDILQINDPVLKEQFDKQAAEAKRVAEEQKKASLQDMIGRLQPATKPATMPSGK